MSRYCVEKHPHDGCFTRAWNGTVRPVVDCADACDVPCSTMCIMPRQAHGLTFEAPSLTCEACRVGALHFQLGSKSPPHDQPPPECSTFPKKYVNFLQRRAHAATIPNGGFHYDDHSAPPRGTTFVFSGGSLFALRPQGAKYEQFNSSCAAAPFRVDPGRNMAALAVLRSLACFFGNVPDAHFGLNVGDIPGSGHANIPVLSIHGYGKSDLALPVAPPMLILSNLHPHAPRPWHLKDNRLIYADGKSWRSLIPYDSMPWGRRIIRDLARNHSDVIYMPQRPIPFRSWAEHKYTLILDGVGPSGRLQFLLSLNSTLFIPDAASHGLNWAMPVLKAWKHYVPVNRELSNLVEQIAWARSHDEEARVIAANAAQLMTRGGGLDQRGRFCSWYEALRAISLAQVGTNLKDKIGPLCPLFKPAVNECDYKHLDET